MVKRPPAIVVQLIHISGPLKNQIQEFSELEISIGRHPSSHLQFPLDQKNISRKHAKIVREGNQFKLVDYSSNGTFVNGKRVKEAILKNGDVLVFSEGGPKVGFLTQIKEGPAEMENFAPPLATETAPSKADTKQGPRPPVEEKVLQTRPPVEPEVLVQPVKVSLIIQYGPTIRSYKELPITLGKNSKSDFAVDHPAVLDQHAQIFFSQNQYCIKDLSGRRLVSVNHVPITLQIPLQPNDEVSLTPVGPVFRFLGEGRLLEVEAPADKDSSDIQPRKDKSAQKVTSEGKEAKKQSSVFMKFFQR